MVAIVAAVLQYVVYDAAARSDAKPAGAIVERVVPK